MFKNLKLKIQISSLLSLLILLNIFPLSVQARVTPEDIVNQKRAAYEERVKDYSALHQKKLENLADKIAQVNKKRTDELSWIMDAQGAILDEYIRKNGENYNKEGVEKARYWITYAHEAVAYQAAKIYIFNLTGEVNIKKDALNLVTLMGNELTSSRNKVIYSQKVLTEVIGK